VGERTRLSLIKELWAFEENRIAVRFAYEWHDDSGHGSGLTATRTGVRLRRFNATPLRLDNDLPIKESDRKYHWPLGAGP